MKFDNIDEKQRFLNKLLNSGREAAINEYMTGKVIPVQKGHRTEILGQKLTIDEVKQKFPGVLIVKCNDQETVNLINEIGK